MKGIILAIFLPYTEQSIVTARVISPMTRQTYALAFCTWTGYAPMFIARENGYFEEAGIDMDIQVIEDESTYGTFHIGMGRNITCKGKPDDGDRRTDDHCRHQFADPAGAGELDDDRESYHAYSHSYHLHYG